MSKYAHICTPLLIYELYRKLTKFHIWTFLFHLWQSFLYTYNHLWTPSIWKKFHIWTFLFHIWQSHFHIRIPIFLYALHRTLTTFHIWMFSFRIWRSHFHICIPISIYELHQTWTWFHIRTFLCHIWLTIHHIWSLYITYMAHIWLIYGSYMYRFPRAAHTRCYTRAVPVIDKSRDHLQ